MQLRISSCSVCHPCIKAMQAFTSHFPALSPWQLPAIEQPLQPLQPSHPPHEQQLLWFFLSLIIFLTAIAASRAMTPTITIFAMLSVMKFICCSFHIIVSGRLSHDQPYHDHQNRCRGNRSSSRFYSAGHKTAKLIDHQSYRIGKCVLICQCKGRPASVVHFSSQR